MLPVVMESRSMPTDTDPERLTIELSTTLTGADISYLLHEDATILDAIRTTIRSRLGL